MAEHQHPAEADEQHAAAERAESEAALRRINYRIFKSSNPDGTKADFEKFWPEMKQSFFGDPPEHEAEGKGDN